MGARVLIVGTGLIGGSIGLALRRTGHSRVRGVDRDPDRSRRAAEIGAIDEAAEDLATACSDTDVVIVATPLGQISDAVRTVAEAAAPGTIVTDVGSAKRPIVAMAEQTLGAGRPFVGGHPMAGSEHEGIDAARAELFDGALWILTPTPATDTGAYRRVNALVASLGARTLALDPDEHDRLVALVSHLPYALATTLMELAGAEGDDRVFRAAAGSFRDVTRTAGSNPRIWRDILSANRDAILDELSAFSRRLDAFRSALAGQDWHEVERFIARARETRRRLPLKGERAPADPFVLEVPIADRAGVLADVTTALGQIGLNIEDIWMEHSGPGGVVFLVVDGTDAADAATRHLRERGYRVAIRPLED
jgi:prephenate dehydrogenase